MAMGCEESLGIILVIFFIVNSLVIVVFVFVIVFIVFIFC